MSKLAMTGIGTSVLAELTTLEKTANKPKASVNKFVIFFLFLFLKSVYFISV
jgi:hypothetical protein